MSKEPCKELRLLEKTRLLETKRPIQSTNLVETYGVKRKPWIQSGALDRNLSL